MAGTKTILKQPVGENMYLCRIPGIAMKMEGDKLIIWSQGDTAKTSMNQSAAFIWFNLDGQKNLRQIKNFLQSKYPDDVNKNDLSEMINDLYSKNMLIVADKQTEIRPLLKVAFSNFWPGFDEEDNYFLWMLSHRVDVMIVDPEKGDPNIVFYSTFPSKFAQQTLGGESVLKICYSPKGSITDLNQCDFLLSDNLDTIKTVCKNVNQYHEIPEWSLFVDWNYYDEMEMWRYNNCVLDDCLPENVCNRIIESLFGDVLNEAANDQRQKLEACQQRAKQQKLTIGLISNNDFEGVYLTIQSIRMHHPEIADQINIIVVDNNPDGKHSKLLQGLEQQIENIYYFPYREIQGSAVKDLVFREARTPFVMCVDSHVLIVPGAIKRLLEYFDAHPNTHDLLQGPLLNHDLHNISTHLISEWEKGMFGKKGYDERGNDINAPSFEIQMQKLGLFACAKDAWPGFNSHFKGCIGGEGYIHEKIRQRGGKTLCLPFLRWIHRPNPPLEENYTSTTHDRIHDYLVGFHEVNLATGPLKNHFIDLIGEEDYKRISLDVNKEMVNPFFYFDVIYCITSQTSANQMQLTRKKFESLGIANRIRFFPPLEPFNSRRRYGFAFTHRYLLRQAQKMKYENILIFHDNGVSLKHGLEELRNSIEELKTIDWNVFHVGGLKTSKENPVSKGHRFLKDVASEKINIQAVAYNNTVYENILTDLPGDITALKNYFLTNNLFFDTYLSTIDKQYIAAPKSQSQPKILHHQSHSPHTHSNEEKEENHFMKVFGEVNPDVEFYIVYSTSNTPYQNWQSELLEYSIKNGQDKDRCQIIKLLSNDSSQNRKDFELGKDVTFLFKEFTDRLPNNEFYAPLNKPYSFIRLTEWWYKQKDLNKDSIFVVFDPDMVWFKPIKKELFPPKKTLFCQHWHDSKVMYPFICSVRDLHKMQNLYRYYTNNLFAKKGYFREMHAFEQAVIDSSLKKITDDNFGPFVFTGNQHLDKKSTYVLHYCNKFIQDDVNIWFKQDYTPKTLTRPWKRPVDWKKVNDEYQRYIIKMIHKIIDKQEKNSYSPPKTTIINKSKLDIYLWGISDDKEYILKNSEYALETAEKFNLKPKMLGLQYDWKYLSHLAHGKVLSRLYILRDLAATIHDNRILLIMDGFDTLFKGNEEEILIKFYSAKTKLLFSSEKAFTYQWPNYKDKYDALSSLYKYVNAGTFIGYANSIKKMANYCINLIETTKGQDRGNEQGLIGKYLYNNLEKKSENKLDHNCELFWVTSKDEKEFNASPFYNQNTKSNPLIYHVIGGRSNNVFLYKKTFTKIMNAKC